MNNYPLTAGYAQGRETSQAAAESVDAETLRAEALAIFQSGWHGTDLDLSVRMGKPFETVQPRRSELTAQGIVADTGKRSNSSRSGKSVVVWGYNADSDATLGGLHARKGADGMGAAASTQNAPTSKNSALLSHDAWGQNYGRTRDAEYWRRKADTYARALGKISVDRTASESILITAKQALGAK